MDESQAHWESSVTKSKTSWRESLAGWSCKDVITNPQKPVSFTSIPLSEAIVLGRRVPL